ncbi:MAG: glutamyl-tRNA reductase, partial [Candidatus Omnitrophica bacterium]|nr:glutamyl-tRNA reductase [Candidatus Omnitrophota bacterium]
MDLILLGISHKSAPLKIRERYSFSQGKLAEILCKLSQNPGLKGVAILSTCNRMEVYAITEVIEKVKDYLFTFLQVNREEQNYF